MAFRWSNAQVVLSGPQGAPLPRGERALHDHSKDEPLSPRKRGGAQQTAVAAAAAAAASAEHAASGDAASFGGAAALARYRKASRGADWATLLACIHGIGACGACEARSARCGRFAKCREHGGAAVDAEGGGGGETDVGPSIEREAPWWFGPYADPGLRLLSADAARAEAAAAGVAEAAWRTEWADIRAEQLALQGEPHGAIAARLAPGRPESIGWNEVHFEAQIATLVREEQWERERAVAYTLLACGGVGALARAAREADASGGGGDSTGSGAGGGDGDCGGGDGGASTVAAAPASAGRGRGKGKGRGRSRGRAGGNAHANGHAGGGGEAKGRTYAHARRIVAETLIRHALRTNAAQRASALSAGHGETAPPPSKPLVSARTPALDLLPNVYANLHGPLSLCQSDPAWLVLRPDMPPGTAFKT